MAMALYVLALKDFDRIHVGETADFIEHIGAGSPAGSFDAQRVIDLVNEWDVYDEGGCLLGANLIAADEVELVRVDPEDRTEGAELVMRINVVLAKAQATIDALRMAALTDMMDKLGTVNDLLPDDPGLPAAVQDLADSAEKLRGFVERSPLPVVHGTLPIVLAALAEAFTARQRPPDWQGGSHDDLHVSHSTH